MQLPPQTIDSTTGLAAIQAPDVLPPGTTLTEGQKGRPLHRSFVMPKAAPEGNPGVLGGGY